ncbi:Vacuolar protein sorting-associated protein 5 [Terramyces sp. JEL0728]|nr:Vacuolar protein sorting-associated protein 5 [Terramyces sp. JEL0728]
MFNQNPWQEDSEWKTEENQWGENESDKQKPIIDPTKAFSSVDAYSPFGALKDPMEDTMKNDPLGGFQESPFKETLLHESPFQSIYQPGFPTDPLNESPFQPQYNEQSQFDEPVQSPFASDAFDFKIPDPFARPVNEPVFASDVIPNPLLEIDTLQINPEKEEPPVTNSEENTPLAALAEKATSIKEPTPLESSITDYSVYEPKSTLSAIESPRLSKPEPTNFDPLSVSISSDVEAPKEEVGVERPKKMYEFRVNVVDPLKVGDKISGYVEYRVTTATSDPKYRNFEFSVMRRFSDFFWLYNQLISKYPGIIIPPIPEKLQLGRFQDDFIESRRYHLEKFLQKVVLHHRLQLDDSLRFFLESETFGVDKKAFTEKNILGQDTTPLAIQAFPSTPDSDKQIEDKKAVLLLLESQLKSLSKSYDILVKQRKDYTNAISEMASSLVALGDTQISGTCNLKILKLGRIHQEISELLDSQNNVEIQYQVMKIQEHLRTIGCIKINYQIRLKFQTSLNQLEQTLQKHTDQLNKLNTTQKHRTDKIQEAEAQLKETQGKFNELQNDFNELGLEFLQELDSFKDSRIKDMCDSVQTYLFKSSIVEKHILRIWESYFST